MEWVEAWRRSTRRRGRRRTEAREAMERAEARDWRGSQEALTKRSRASA